jgi:hypothetical protein
MTDAHLHLLVNHLPIVGAALSTLLWGLALVTGGERGALRAAALAAVFTGAGAAAAQLTGEPAEEAVERLPWADEALMHEHEERAEAATVVAVISGVLGLVAWGIAEKKDKGNAVLTGAALVGAIGTAGLMGWTGQAGGQIRHDEIRDGAPTTTTGAVGAAEAGEEEDDD